MSEGSSILILCTSQGYLSPIKLMGPIYNPIPLDSATIIQLIGIGAKVYEYNKLNKTVTNLIVDGEGKLALNIADNLPIFNDLSTNAYYDIVYLVGITNTIGTECTKGDKYFKISTALIYTAAADDVWGTNGVSPELNRLYIDVSTGIIYRWTGSAMEALTKDIDKIANIKNIVVNTDAAPALSTILNNAEYRCVNETLTAAPTMTLGAIASNGVDFSSTVIFKAPTVTAPVITNDSTYSIRYFGTDVTEGVWTPVVGKLYTMEITFNGTYIKINIIADA